MSVAMGRFLVTACVAWKFSVLALDPEASVGLRGAAAEGAVEGANPAAAETLNSSGATVMLLKSPFGMAFGVALGMAMMTFAGKSILRTKNEQKHIQKLFDANTSGEELQQMATAGKELPSLVIVCGVVSADGDNVPAVSPSIDGLNKNLGKIDQPENQFIKIAQMAKKDPNFKPLTDKVASTTGIKPSDIPDVEDDYTHAHVDFKGDAAFVMSEMLVARLCPTVMKKEDKDKNIEIVRKCRNQSYACFYGRKMSEGLHLLDMQGGRLELKPPSAALLPQFSPIHHGEAPPLFLPTNNVTDEFLSYIRKEGLTVQGKHLDFSKMPPTKITDPDTLLSKFIFIDVQSTTDLGAVGGNQKTLEDISAAYDNAKFLWEPRGFYDHNVDKLPSYAEDQQAEMVLPREMLRKAGVAATLNSRHTPFCEPTFARDSLTERRHQEDCFRVTELAIPRGSDVTVLAKPVKTPDGKVMLVAPNSAEDGADVDNPEAERFRFRILKGHSVENLLKQRSLNIMEYYGQAIVGAFLCSWAAAGYPGLST